MSFNLIGDRATACRDGVNEEKVKVVGYGRGDILRVQFPDGEVLEKAEHQLLVDKDHQTVLDLDKCGGDHLLSLQYHPNAAIDVVAQHHPDVTKITKMRLDVLSHILEAVSMYPNTGSAITTLIAGIPKKG